MPEAIEAQDIILTANGQPFKTREIAQASISRKGLDKNTHDPVPLEDGGWGIAVVPPKVGKEKYFRVRFHPKGHPNDPDDVCLIVNGETLNIQREAEIIIPGRFKECADNARYPVHKEVPGRDRKVTHWIRTFNYDLIGEATEQEFKKMFNEGNKRTRENIKRYGYNVQPEDVEDGIAA